mmetsp:Transcript_48561/g.138808  ORF Transcript_48561/g.138808 Transcript_48561/m.138808 type:complete len:208 (+) Transcript_48561:193-816(+)
MPHSRDSSGPALTKDPTKIDGNNESSFLSTVKPVPAQKQSTPPEIWGWQVMVHFLANRQSHHQSCTGARAGILSACKIIMPVSDTGQDFLSAYRAVGVSRHLCCGFPAARTHYLRRVLVLTLTLTFAFPPPETFTFEATLPPDPRVPLLNVLPPVTSSMLTKSSIETVAKGTSSCSARNLTSLFCDLPRLAASRQFLPSGEDLWPFL